MNSDFTQTLPSFMKQCEQRANDLLRRQIVAHAPSVRLREAMEHAALGGGKRLRPVLVYGSALAVGGTLDAADAAASAVELIHNYSLVHDDLPAMDDDDLRRGRPTVHKAFDEATAILVGDALQSLAFRVLSEPSTIAPATQLRMVQILSEAAGELGMVGGQSLDFDAMGKLLSLEALETMHKLKTGALIRASVALGGLSHAGTTAVQLQALENYALNVGLAFQVRDDILDVTSDTATLGKPQGSDRKSNKPTYVSLLGVDAAKDKATELAETAIATLADFPPEADHLRELASYIVSRLH
jgi:geranylgeranyl pyrophosphate synthase